MTELLAASWHAQKIIGIGGPLVALAGLAVFGWHFIRINGRAAQGESNEIPTASWRGAGARSGLLILAVGVLLGAGSMILSARLPVRY